MSKQFANTAPSGDDRGRQAKALDAYDSQRAVWDRVQKNLAKKLNRADPSETLPGSVFHHRLRNEELGILDAAVPASMRNGSNAWEMSLRGGAGGVRFVQIGKAYPYPLYCPIRDSDCVPSDSNTLMRMFPMDKIPPRNKPAAESEYFHDRQAQFRKFVQKKFSHFQPNQEAMIVEGARPPQASSPIHEDNSVEPVLFIPTDPRSAAASSQGHPVTQYLTEEPKSRPLSAVTAPVAPTQQTPNGPMLCFSASHVSFSTSPGESSQGSITVDNVGSTAVYYSWAVVPQVPIMEDMKQPDCFHLSDASSGVLLPEEQKLFTFTVRASLPGVYTKQYELLTVPAGKERIVVQLRAVVISNEVNYVATSSLESELHKKAMRDYQRHVLTESIWNPENLVLDHANIEIEIRDLSKAKAKKLAELQGVGEFQEGNWYDRNAPLKIPYNQAVYSKLLVLHRNFHQFLKTVNSLAPPLPLATAGTTSPAGDGAAVLSPPPLPGLAPPAQAHAAVTPVAQAADWDGSVKSLIEDIALLKDASARNMFMKALQALLACAEVTEDRSDSLHVLLSRSAGRKSWGQAIDEMVKYVPVARDLAEGKSVKAKVEKVETGKGSKPPPKAAAKPPPKGSAAAAASPDPKAGDAAAEAKHPNFDKFFHAGVRRIIGDAVESMFGRHDDTFELIAAATDRPFEYAVKRRMDAISATQAAPDVEQEIVQDTAKPKKK